MITAIVTGVLLVALGFGGNAAWAHDGCCSGCGLFTHAKFVPSVTYYAPYPYWWPRYIGPPYTDYLPVQYVTPPAESAAIVKERIRALNSANPALLPPSEDRLPPPKPDK